ncbi:hypothetical protein K402DRAFT_261818 [Aulographum hederae CBS 113979]|uniref:Uncharacterized protein n=1 Tax=Aulographum hederae CBS 113979 TaxID=1176131 RepID=A0A6G1H969_9PEZI|nr:hypothetical protein K402DRAFT_261818 [Aulographum hederae CBS 113979]
MKSWEKQKGERGERRRLHPQHLQGFNHGLVEHAIWRVTVTAHMHCTGQPGAEFRGTQGKKATFVSACVCHVLADGGQSWRFGNPPASAPWLAVIGGFETRNKACYRHGAAWLLPVLDMSAICSSVSGEDIRLVLRVRLVHSRDLFPHGKAHLQGTTSPQRVRAAQPCAQWPPLISPASCENIYCRLALTLLALCSNFAAAE